MAECSLSVDENANLSSLIKDTVTTIQKDVICERAIQIQKAIIFYLTLFLNKVAELEPLFKVSELIQAGSFKEGTKILKPDEFDFLAVIEDLSRPNMISINHDPEKISGSTSLPQAGFVTVDIRDDTMKCKWKNYYDNGLLQCFQNAFNRVRFGNLFVSVIKNLYRERRPPKRNPSNVITCSSTEIDFLNCALCLPPVNGVSLRLRRVEFRTPNVVLDFQVDTQAISVDLSPAIRYHKPDDCFKYSNCCSSSFTELILGRESLLLVASRNFDFRVTVTEAEIEYIQTVMKPEHKAIYIFLKYINHTFSSKLRKWDPFSSYMLKNVCWTHDVYCNEQTRTVDACFKKVVEEICEYCSKKELPSVVNSRLDLFIRSVDEDFYLRATMVDVLRKISKYDGIKKVEEFQKFLEELISQRVTQFDKMLDENRHKLR